jgi:hypothetical protein
MSIEFMRGIQESGDGKGLPERSLGSGWLRSIPAVLSLSRLHELACVPDSCIPTGKKPGSRAGLLRMGKCG